jgi:hypothetical protein
VQIFPNAVRFDWYRENLAEPDELIGIKHPRIGYIGSINEKLDFDWFEKLLEYSAAGLLIVGTPLRAMTEDPAAQKLVRFVADAAEAIDAIDAIDKALMDKSEDDRRREYARLNSWQVRSEYLFGLIQEKIANPS